MTFGTWTYAYDDAGNIASSSDPKAQLVNYTYDNINRPLTEDFTGGAGTEVTYAYDACSDGKGRLCSATASALRPPHPVPHSTVYRGSYSLRMTYNQAWGGLLLHSDTGIPGSSYDTVKFAINGGSTGGQRPYVILYRPDQSLLGTVYLPDIIGTIAPNTWYQVSIPLSSFGVTNQTIGEFSIESPTATTIYLDDIRFEGHAQGGAATRYTYDHAGQRTSYFDGLATTTYPTKYYDKVGNTTHKNIFAGNDLVATVEATGLATTTYTVHTDHLGGTNVVTDASGALNQTLSYYPFGSTRINAKQGSFDEKNKFTGHKYDDATSLYYMNARYQNPAIGRFVSQDPSFLMIGVDRKKDQAQLSQPQKLNSYACGDNNPITKYDPDERIR